MPKGNILKNIFGGGASKLINSIGGVIDNLVTSDEERQELKAKIAQVVNDQLLELMKLQADIIQTEMQGNWLQRSWRPVVMLAFGTIVVLGAFMDIPYLESDHQFWKLLELGLGGYVIGRSVEKVAGSVSQNLDLGALKRKDRKDNFN